MPTTSPRRIVRRAVVALAVVVLLVAWYVGAWLTISKAEEIGFVSSHTAQAARPAFEPIIAYCDSGMPGGRLLSDVWWKMNSPMARYHENGQQYYRDHLAPPRASDN